MAPVISSSARAREQQDAGEDAHLCCLSQWLRMQCCGARVSQWLRRVARSIGESGEYYLILLLQ